MSHKRRRATIVVKLPDGILIVSHSRHGKPMYMLPGGGIKHNENPYSAAKRELYEETGLHTSKIVYLFDFSAHQLHKVFFAETYGRLRKRHETTHIRFYNDSTKDRYKLAGNVKSIIERCKNILVIKE